MNFPVFFCLIASWLATVRGDSTYIGKITADPSVAHVFGYQLAMWGTTRFAATAKHADRKIFIYDYVSSAWSQSYVLQKAEWTQGQQMSLAFQSADCLFATSYNTGFYVYRLTAGDWSLEASYTPTMQSVYPIAIEGNNILVGYGNGGAIVEYLTYSQSDAFSLIQTISGTASNPSHYGMGVALNGNVGMVTHYELNLIYVYALQNGQFSQQSTLTISGPGAVVFDNTVGAGVVGRGQTEGLYYTIKKTGTYTWAVMQSGVGRPSDNTALTSLGYGLAMSGTTALISACQYPNKRHGEVYQYSVNPPPTVAPSEVPSTAPTMAPTDDSTEMPSVAPSVAPSIKPSASPSLAPSLLPTVIPSVAPSVVPSVKPTLLPSVIPSAQPSVVPSVVPSVGPSVQPSVSPSTKPSVQPSVAPSIAPTVQPSVVPSLLPSLLPSVIPSVQPSAVPTVMPSIAPTVGPTVMPSISPSFLPSCRPTLQPTILPTIEPSLVPTVVPTTRKPTYPHTHHPSIKPTAHPTFSLWPTRLPTMIPSMEPSEVPSEMPSAAPTDTSMPSVSPTRRPSRTPTWAVSAPPTLASVEISFNSDIYLHNVSVSVLDVPSQNAVTSSVADTLSLNDDQVSFVGQELVGGSAATSAHFQVKAVVKVAASTRDFGDATDQDGEYLFAKLTASLSDAVNTQTFVDTLRYKSIVHNATATKNVGQVNVTSSASYVVTNAVSEPDNTDNDDFSRGDFAGVVIGIVVSFLIVVGCVLAVWKYRGGAGGGGTSADAASSTVTGVSTNQV